MTGDIEQSFRRGSLRELPVAEDYKVVEGEVTPVGGDLRKWTRYFPVGIDDLPAEFAKLAGGDEELILAFVRRRGLLGYDYLRSFDPYNGFELEDDALARDPVDWIVLHAKTVQMVLFLLGERSRSEKKSQPAILQNAIKGRIDIDVDLSKELPGIRFAVGSSRQLDSFLPTSQSLQRPGIVLIELLVEILEPSMDHLRRSHFKDDGALIPSFSFPALLPVIYYHLDLAATGSKDYVQCDECSNYFYRTHGRQRYCPHPDHLKYPDLESQCAVRGRNRKWRGKQNER